jgi:hypothetical protein
VAQSRRWRYGEHARSPKPRKQNKLRVADCVADRIRPVVPQATEEQRVGNQIDAAMIFALTISAKPVGVGVVSQRSIPTDKQSLLQMRTVMMESVSLCVPIEKLTAFIGLEAAIRGHCELA